MIRRAGALVAGVAVAASITTCIDAPGLRTTTHSYPVTLTTQVFMMGGLGWEDMPTDVMQSVLGGRWSAANIAVENLHGLSWPASLAPSLNYSVNAGVQSTIDAVFSTNPDGTLTLRYPDEMNIVGGASAGTFVVNAVMMDLEQRRQAGQPVPNHDQLSFAVLGDADRGMFRGFTGVKLPLFEYTVPELPETPYDLTVVTGEYDGLGDWPDRWWNLLADFNALAGTSMLQQILPPEIVDPLHLNDFGSVHREAMDADLSTVPPENITVTLPKTPGMGVVTTYLVPTADLPMLRPLKGFGVPQPVIDSLTAVLRPIIDSAYIRNDPHGTGSTGQPGAAAASVTSAASKAAAKPARAKAAAAAAAPGSDSTSTPKRAGKAGSKRAAHRSNSEN